MLIAPQKFHKQGSFAARLCLGSLLLLATLGTASAQASIANQAAELGELGELSMPADGIAAPIPSPPVLRDPTLHLPEAAPQISRLVLRLSERRLYAYQGDREVASYPVAVGRNDWETPTGEFTVFQRQQHPAWEHPLTGQVVPPGPGNPLGARWLGFWTDGTNSIGFHGTPHEHLIGQAVSHGCVRMRNADVIELYDRVEIGTPVIVMP